MSNILLEAALAYASERGWPIFPVRADKTPYTRNGVVDATTDLAQIRRWWGTWPGANIGLDVGGAGLMVLDLDPGHDLKELDRNVGGLPPTQLRQRTPRGGEHLFYALDPGEIVSPSASKVAPRVDVRSFHSYVLLSPSRTGDGAYTWEGEGKPAHRTDEMVRVANSHREKHEDRDTWLIEPDLDENIAAAIEWLKGPAKIAIEGRGGDDCAYRTAAMCKSFGLSEETALELMWEHWNPRCVPPWSADEYDHLETKVRNGYSYNTSPPGNVTPAYRVARSAALFKPVAVDPDLPGIERKAGKFRFVDRDRLDTIKPPEWLIPDLLPEGASAIMFGARGSFKTFAALDMALTVATGGGADTWPWDGIWPQASRGAVLYNAGEGRSQFSKRVRAWEATHYAGAKVQNFVLSDPVPLVNMGSEEWGAFVDGALALQPAGYKLVVIDTIGRSMAGLNENAQEHASKYTMLAEFLQKELGCTVLGLGHTGHEKGAGHMRGSSVFGADVDTELYLSREAKEYMIGLSMTKQKDAPEWEKSRFIKLREHTFPDKSTSLVAIKPPPDEEKRAVSNPAVAAAQEKMIAGLLDKLVMEVLASNKARSFTTKDLADHLISLTDESGGLRIRVGARTLQTHNLPALRENENARSRRCYDPGRKAWRYRD